VTSRQAVTYVELDISVCSLTYGVAPCTASVGVTGADKCLNSKKTCQDTANFTDSTVTLRFAMPADFLPTEIDCIPCIAAVPEHSPGRVSLGEDLGERASLKVMLRDQPHSDAGSGFDKYFATRAYNPYAQGTLFGKFRARQPFLRGRALRWYQGFVGDALADMEIRYFVVDSFDGPSQDGIYTIVAKDVLKLLDGDRAQAPALSSGFLSADITDVDTSLTLLPANIGVGIAEYPASGYVCIGGNEICSFGHDPYVGNDADTKLLLHFDGVDNATTFTDSSPAARAITRGGSAVLDDVHKVFGATSLRLQSAGGDFVSAADSADWDLTADFSIGGRFYFTTLNGGRLFSQASSTTVGYRLTINADGSLEFLINNTTALLTLTTAAGVIAAGAFYDINVERYGNLWTLFVDGVIKVQTTAVVSVPAIASLFRVGAGSAGTNPMNGWVDEFRFARRATWLGVAFTPLTVAYQTSGDVMTIVRAQKGTTASSHQQQDRVQLVLTYSAQSPGAIIRDLEVTYAGVPSAYIDLTTWQDEIDLFLGQVYTADIPEPTPVKQLIEELIEQAGLAHWWDDTAQELRLLVIREVDSTAATFDANNRLADSLEIVDQPQKRISRVQTYYGLIDPTKGIEDPDNFRAVQETIDTEAESDYGNVVIKQIKSRWIPQFGDAIATVLNGIQLARYRDPPRRFVWDVLRDVTGVGVVPALGGGYQLAAYPLQDAYGAASDAPVQVTRVTAGPAVVQAEAEEMLFNNAILADPNNHVVVISTSTNNFNLRTRHDILYGTPVSGDTVTCRINAGVIVGSADTSQFAFDTGDWPAGVTLIIEVNGRIQGASGQGGQGARQTEAGLINAAEAGGEGGDALKVRFACSLGGTGKCWSGGGGGGGGGAQVSAVAPYKSDGGGGGGGQGQVAGAGGLHRGNAEDGGDGTADAAGTGGDGGSSGAGGVDGKRGGDGGVKGAAGSHGTNGPIVLGAAGGAAGNAIDGNSFVTETGTVDIQGARI
jgi:hypothetical protein